MQLEFSSQSAYLCYKIDIYQMQTKSYVMKTEVTQNFDNREKKTNTITFYVQERSGIPFVDTELNESLFEKFNHFMRD